MRLDEITRPELSEVERFANKLWSKVGIEFEFTVHFFDRLNDQRNGKPIAVSELVRLLKKEYESYGKQIAKLDDRSVAIMRDLTTQINLPFLIRDTEVGKTVVAKSIIRKSNYHTAGQEFSVK